jgi:peroxiredoxin
MPLFVEAYAQNHAERLTIFAIDGGENTATVQDFVDNFGVEFPVGLDAGQSVTQNYRIFGMPTTFFINRQGVIDYVVAGAVREPDLRRLVDMILQDGVEAP